MHLPRRAGDDREVPAGAADRAAAAGAHRGLGLPVAAAGSGWSTRFSATSACPSPPGSADPHLALLSILLIGFPWISNLGFLIFLGGLQNLPKDVLDAAKLDGVGAVRRVFTIDIPLLMPQFRIVVILSGIFAVQNFVPILLLTNGGPGTATLVPGLDMYQSAFSRTTSTATAWRSAPCSSLRMLVFTLVAMRLLRPRTT